MPRSLLMRRTLVSIAIVALLLLVSSLIRSQLASMREPPAKVPEIERRIAVRVREARRVDFREELSGYGRARAMRRTSVAAEVAGLVTRISRRLEAGNGVEKGEELVWLDDRDRRNQVAAIEARLLRNAADGRRLSADRGSLKRQLEIAREELAIAQRELERVDTLVERGVATSSARDAEVLRLTLRRSVLTRLDGEIQKSEAQRDSNAAQKRELEISLRQARTDLERTIVAAPYDGRIETRTVQNGSRVAPGTALFELVDLKRIEIPVSLPASRFGDVRIGAEAEVQLPGNDGGLWSATVVRLAPTVRADDRTFLVYLESTGPGAVPPGAFVSATITGRSYKNVFAIPRTAFVGDRIFVARDGIARLRRPHVVKALPATLLCDSGLEEGERIIVTNLEEVADGSRVAPTETSYPAEDA